MYYKTTEYKEQPSWKDKFTVGWGVTQDHAKRTMEWVQMMLYIGDRDMCEKALFDRFWVRAC